jgi:hypothetical protein
MEGYINLFINDYKSDGDNKPNFKGYLKIDGVDHEFALWPNREGKQGYSGKYKPKNTPEPVSNVTQADADKAWEEAKMKMTSPSVATNIKPSDLPDDDIPF